MIGILALQGGFELHAKHLTALNQPWCYVRTAEQFININALILPGGESTVLLKLMSPSLAKAIQKHHAAKKPIFATCAGVILLAKHVQPQQSSLGLLDITVERNAYGRQLDSFSAEGLIHLSKEEHPQPMVFIRAPRIIEIGKNVKVLASYKNDIVCIKQDHIIAATFHPELTDNHQMHRYFISMVHTQQSNYAEKV